VDIVENNLTGYVHIHNPEGGYFMNISYNSIRGDVGYLGTHALMIGNNVTGSISFTYDGLEGTIIGNNIGGSISFGGWGGFCSVLGNNIAGSVTFGGHWIGGTISGNNIEGGIHASHPHDSLNIYRNNITTDHSGTGIYVSGMIMGTVSIFENNIFENALGISIATEFEPSPCSIFHNNFINNTCQVSLSVAYPLSWDDGYPSGGNYWSDYTDVDLYWGSHQNETGSDGIGDTPYIIDENNNDNYPLMSPYEYWGNPILGDINKDMKVDDKDLFQLAAAYGSIPEKPNWNPNCDFDEDNKIEALDLFDLSKNYGKTA